MELKFEVRAADFQCVGVGSGPRNRGGEVLGANRGEDAVHGRELAFHVFGEGFVEAEGV